MVIVSNVLNMALEKIIRKDHRMGKKAEQKRMKKDANSSSMHTCIKFELQCYGMDFLFG